MEISASKSVAMTGSGDKRAKTAMFTIDLAGNFLPMQLIYGGKTKSLFSKVFFTQCQSRALQQRERNTKDY